MRTASARLGAAILASLLLAALALAAPASAANTETFVVLFKAQSIPTDADKKVKSYGGAIVARYPQIGVMIVKSSKSNFGSAMRADSRVEGASATAAFATKLEDDQAEGPPPGELTNTPVTDGAEPLFGLQWDMSQINTPAAHAITGGSASILVGDLDTGLDFTHPDIAANYDAANSADCSSGAPQPLLVGNDQNGHGTHTAGTIAAAANGIGIVGVAPKVRIAGVKTSNDDGFFFPEMVVCAFMWAGAHDFDVTNNSYFADPWLYNCRNDPSQRAIWKAEQRAIRWAQSRGVAVVSSAGNQNLDLSKTATDEISPDFPPGSEIEREVTAACLRIPSELPGVVTVSATGDLSLKSFYSDYGLGVVDIAAPGGDSLFQVTPAAVNGRVLSTYPSYRSCLRPVVDQGATYCYLQGTSMAAPHVTGAVALVKSWYGPMSSGSAISIVEGSANPLPCPANPYREGTGFDAVCEGGAVNGFYGHGELDVLAALGG
jgi:subtilisin family serine protease